jgi:hypothetical protein
MLGFLISLMSSFSMSIIYLAVIMDLYSRKCIGWDPALYYRSPDQFETEVALNIIA